MTTKRGSLIVFEGLDRSGKSTQSKLLHNFLVKSKLYAFPNNTVPTGNLINQYLANKLPALPQTMHLLFSANRWELQPVIISNLLQGNTVILDRYYHSGFAYSQAKAIPRPWIFMSDIGLTAPDHVFFMDIHPNIASQRQDYGKQIYENIPFQCEVQKHFYQLRESNWTILDATKPINELHEIIKNVVLKLQISPNLSVFAC